VTALVDFVGRVSVLRKLVSGRALSHGDEATA
jgi:hypothetical protein